MFVPVLWMAMQFPIQVQMTDITEMGCDSSHCMSLTDVANLPPGRLPAGCQLQMVSIIGQIIPPEPVLICESPPQPLGAESAGRPRPLAVQGQKPKR